MEINYADWVYRHAAMTLANIEQIVVSVDAPVVLTDAGAWITVKAFVQTDTIDALRKEPT